jgi:hypothetical protein
MPGHQSIPFYHHVPGVLRKHDVRLLTNTLLQLYKVLSIEVGEDLLNDVRVIDRSNFSFRFCLALLSVLRASRSNAVQPFLRYQIHLISFVELCLASSLAECGDSFDLGIDGRNICGTNCQYPNYWEDSQRFDRPDLAGTAVASTWVVDSVALVSGSSCNISIDWVRAGRVGRVDASVVSGGSDSGTTIISTSSFWLDCASVSVSASNSSARLFSGDEDRCGKSSAPPIIALCANGSKGD